MACGVGGGGYKREGGRWGGAHVGVAGLTL